MITAENQHTDHKPSHNISRFKKIRNNANEIPLKIDIDEEEEDGNHGRDQLNSETVYPLNVPINRPPADYQHQPPTQPVHQRKTYPRPIRRPVEGWKHRLENLLAHPLMKELFTAFTLFIIRKDVMFLHQTQMTKSVASSLNIANTQVL